MKHLSTYLSLAYCAEEIFYDNGMVNRFSGPPNGMIESALAHLVDKFGEDRVMQVEIWLSHYHKDDLLELCTDSEYFKPKHPSMPADVELMLDEIFEES